MKNEGPGLRCVTEQTKFFECDENSSVCLLSVRTIDTDHGAGQAIDYRISTWTAIYEISEDYEITALIIESDRSEISSFGINASGNDDCRGHGIEQRNVSSDRICSRYVQLPSNQIVDLDKD
jgi:hypothetical protein